MKIISSRFQTIRSLICVVLLRQKSVAVPQLVSACILLFPLFAGCDGSRAKTAIGGKVSIVGASAPGILVEFYPLKGGPRFQGETDSQGAFVLRSENGTNMPFGKYKVLLHDYATVDNFLGTEGDGVDANKGKKSRVAPEFSSLEKTPLSREVTTTANFFSLELP